MATQLDLFNGALLLAGERFLGSLTENREPRRLLDHVWSTGGVKACLEAGQWNFAMRTIMADYDTAVVPDFGYARAFEKPEDWCLTSAVCSDEFFRSPLLRYWDEAGFWYADVDQIYVRYVSDDPLYGMDLGMWPQTFFEYVCADFASRIILRLSNSQEELQKVEKIRDQKLLKAKSAAAMAEPTSFPARGNWGLSRNGWSYRRDGGNTSGSLY